MIFYVGVIFCVLFFSDSMSSEPIRIIDTKASRHERSRSSLCKEVDLSQRVCASSYETVSVCASLASEGFAQREDFPMQHFFRAIDVDDSVFASVLNEMKKKERE